MGLTSMPYAPGGAIGAANWCEGSEFVGEMPLKWTGDCQLLIAEGDSCGEDSSFRDCEVEVAIGCICGC